MDNTSNNRTLSAALLKNIAMITMIIDHLTQLVWGYYVLDRGYLPKIAYPIYVIGTGIIGRISMPLFCFLIAEGVYYTKNRGRYLLRIFITGVAAFIPYIFLTGGLPLHFTDLNVMFTFSVAILTVMCMDRVKKLWQKIIIVLAACALSELTRCEYGSAPVLMAAAVYYFRDDRRRQLYCGIAGFIIGTVINAFCTNDLSMIESQIPALAAFLFIAAYNGGRGKQLPKWVYYGFYPVHLALLALIRLIFP